MKRLSKTGLWAIVVILGTSLLLGAGVAAWDFMRHIDPNFMLPPTRLTVVLTHEFSQDIKRHIATYGFVDFDQLADFEWTHMLVVLPYQDPQQILEENGLRRQRINSYIKWSDLHTLLIFLNDGKVVAYIVEIF